MQRSRRYTNDTCTWKLSRANNWMLLHYRTENHSEQPIRMKMDVNSTFLVSLVTSQFLLGFCGISIHILSRMWSKILCDSVLRRVFEYDFTHIRLTYITQKGFTVSQNVYFTPRITWRVYTVFSWCGYLGILFFD